MKGDNGMSHVITRGLALAFATAPFLIACGGGKADNPGPVNAPQCSGASCGVQGPPATGADAALAIGPGLAKAALAIKVDGVTYDMSRELPTDGDGRIEIPVGDELDPNPGWGHRADRDRVPH